MSGEPSSTRVRRVVVARVVSRFGEVLLRRGERLRIGRHPRNDVVLDDPGVSRFHVSVAWRRAFDIPLLADLGSEQGTWVGGRRVQALPLDDGSRFRVGSCEFSVFLEEEPLGPDAASAQARRPAAAPPAGVSGSGALRGITWDLGELLTDLQARRDSGTLRLSLRDLAEPARITVSGGRVISADLGLGALDLDSLRRALRARVTSYVVEEGFEAGRIVPLPRPSAAVA